MANRVVRGTTNLVKRVTIGRWVRSATLCWLCLLSGLTIAVAPAIAQIDNELRDLYREMIPQFDGELKAKLQQALREGQNYIELNSEQFREFRDHPANPFDGWDGIDPNKISGKIRLQFETQPVRSRRAGPWERQSSQQLDQLKPVVSHVSRSTVQILDGARRICLGTIVTSDGYIVTKASEIADVEKLACRTYDGQRYSADIAQVNEENDLALIKIDARDLTAIEWSSRQPLPGSFLISPDAQGTPMAMGVYSHVPRSLVGQNQAYLGVKPVQLSGQGLRLDEVTRGGAAHDAGLQVGDVVTTFDGQPMNSVTDLVNAIRTRRPGDQVLIEFERDGRNSQVQAVLAGRNLPSHEANRMRQMNRFGAIPSQRHSDFPMVLQHDTPLLPEQCGGPLCDLDGNVVGLNIARAGRVASYAIPAEHVRTLVNQMLVPAVAQRPDNETADRK